MSAQPEARPVVIRVRSREGEGEPMELISQGRYVPLEDGWMLSYAESALSGMAGAYTRVMLQGDRATVERTDAVSSTMVFQAGKRCPFTYSLPEGTLRMGVDCQRVDGGADAAGGWLTLRYGMELGGGQAVSHSLELTYRFHDA